MIANVNIEEVKKFNGALKQYKDKAVQINTEIEFLNKEIATMCADLSAEIGVTVTVDNIESICEDIANKINTSLEAGKVVLAKIASEEASAEAQAQAQMLGAQEVTQTAPVAPVLPMNNMATEPATPVFANTNQVFNTTAGEFGGVSLVGDTGGAVDPSTLPSLFGNRK